MAIVCLEDLDGQARNMGGGPPHCYGLFTEWLFDEWGVGRKEQNDGVMLVLFRRGRRVEIRTGKGLKYKLPESFLQSVVDQRMIPAFKEGRHANGVEVGAGAILRRLMPTRTLILGPRPSAPCRALAAATARAAAAARSRAAAAAAATTILYSGWASWW